MSLAKKSDIIETRERNISINRAGGNASRSANNYRISLPTPWMKQMGIDPDNRDVVIGFDGDRIYIEKNA